jgi:hypothetical protein
VDSIVLIDSYMQWQTTQVISDAAAAWCFGPTLDTGYHSEDLKGPGRVFEGDAAERFSKTRCGKTV